MKQEEYDNDKMKYRTTADTLITPCIKYSTLQYSTIHTSYFIYKYTVLYQYKHTLPVQICSVR